MPSLLSRLNGWQRLWLVFTIICFILATMIVVLGQRYMTAIEDMSALMAQYQQDAIHVQILVPAEGHSFIAIYDVLPNSDVVSNIRAKYPQYGEMTDSALAIAVRAKYSITTIIEFPKGFSDTEVQGLLKTHNELDTICAIAAKMKSDRIQEQLLKARSENDRTRHWNTSLAIFTYVGWLFFVGSVYALGYAIGWIYRGFKRP